MDNEKLINVFEKSNSISEVLKVLNISDNSSNWRKIKALAIEIGFDLDTYKNIKKRFCLNCNKELLKGQKKFCSNSCSSSSNNKGRVVSAETRDKIKNTLSISRPRKTEIKVKKIKEEKTNIKNNCKNCGIEIRCGKFCSSKCSNELVHKDSYLYFINNPDRFNNGGYVPKNFKDFFLIEQDNKCDICEIENKWNNNKLIFVLDHIDGDASNNKRENLRLICPNCDSQTDTFKSKNKNSTRRNYWKEKIIRDIETEK